MCVYTPDAAGRKAAVEIAKDRRRETGAVRWEQRRSEKEKTKEAEVVDVTTNNERDR